MCIEPNSKDAERIRKNFLLIEHNKESMSEEIREHDIDIEGFGTIRINKIKTDNYKIIYKSLSNLHLPVSAMDVRKVQDVFKEIKTGGEIKVSITDNLETLKNGEKVLAIGSIKNITYEFNTSSEMMSIYFKIIDEDNSQILTQINKYKITGTQYFPIFGFSIISDKIEKEIVDKLKKQQVEKLNSSKKSTKKTAKNQHTTIELIENDDRISASYKNSAIMWSVLLGNINLDIVENYLRKYENKEDTNYRKLLCAYDFKKYCSEEKYKII